MEGGREAEEGDVECGMVESGRRGRLEGGRRKKKEFKIKREE